jgi:hypothetical protein
MGVKINGSTGTAALSGGATTYITAWSIDITGDVIKTSDSSVSTPFWDTYISAGFKGWSGTFEGFQETNTADLVVGAAAASLVLELDASRNYTGDVIITGCSTTLDVPGAEAAKKSYTFVGTGAVALTNG